jgi:hypothetical protein
MTTEDYSPQSTPQASLLDRLLIPLAVAIVASIFTASITVYFTERYRTNHSVSVSIIRSDSAAPQEPPSLFEDNPLFPLPTPTPDPEPIYTYTTLVRNNGDFPETSTTISISFRNGDQAATPIARPELDASSSLLSLTITPTDPVESLPSFAMTVDRIRPGEWISLTTSWRQPMRIQWEVRSADVAESSDD